MNILMYDEYIEPILIIYLISWSVIHLVGNPVNQLIDLED